ncbi:unknown protein [Microcystis aeruginosa NIES-843]|uniref:Uncharacterized protein n=1 Tax=Microcystis aeruginosa (strain NIES-843 / IAM M-2473) TaxID=449447 RepID=B0JMA4_MICAN|nr:unknown protein [Microcystis aeruginosa NIES-843]
MYCSITAAAFIAYEIAILCPQSYYNLESGFPERIRLILPPQCFGILGSTSPRSKTWHFYGQSRQVPHLTF